MKSSDVTHYVDAQQSLNIGSRNSKATFLLRVVRVLCIFGFRRTGMASDVG